MIAMKASEIASVIQGTLHGEDVTVTEAAVINSSEAMPGSLFLAVKGEKVDGLDFVAAHLDRRLGGAGIGDLNREPFRRGDDGDRLRRAVEGLCQIAEDDLGGGAVHGHGGDALEFPVHRSHDESGAAGADRLAHGSFTW